MSGSGGIGQLLKGVIMGVVLILAIIGSMSMLEKNKADDSTTNTTPISSPSTSSSPEIRAPEINIASQTPTQATTQTPPTASPTTMQATDNFQPVLEGEKSEAEKQAEEEKKQEEVIKYGILKLSAVSSENKESLKAGFVVFDNKNTKITESNNTTSASYRLPVGSYNVISTLVNSNDATTRGTAPVQSTKTITISANKLTDEIFELEPPPTIGVLQVSATNAKNSQAMKANFIIQKENGETVATRQNVTNSLFKLKAGSYKVTVRNGNNSDFRTVVVEPGESATEVFKLQESFLQGKVLVRVFDINSNNPVQADIEISASNGKIMQALKSVSQTEIALSEGVYKIKVTGTKGESRKNITVIAGQSSNQVFRISAPSTSNTTPTTNSVQINDNVSISDAGENNPNDAPTESTQTNESTESVVTLFARNEIDQKPIKSNFYVQTPNGKHLAKKTYVDSAKFNLKPGKYKITVRSNNRKNIIRNIQISANQAITEVFSMQRNIPVPTNTNQQANKPVAVSATTKPSKVIPNGFLNVTMQPAKRTHFIITNKKGKKIVELTSVPSGNFKLDTGAYTVTAILNSQRRNQTIRIQQGKTTRLNFNANDFKKKTVTNNTVKKGGLRSRIVDNNGRPLRGNLTVTNSRGQIVARANNVTFGVFDLPAVPHTISVNYQGLSGSERVNIAAGKTTVQTFTIAPDNANAKPFPAQKPRDSNDILRDKLKEELRRIF